MSAFSLLADDRHARAGVLRTAHGEVPTPAFMPVGTQASVKGVAPDELLACGVRVLLANAYHLYLRPGAEVIAAAGGLHRFMAWPASILTDSGGFQIFSLSRLARIDDEGYHFASHLDGSRHTFTPESVVALQEQLGSDIAMVLDHVVAGDADAALAEEAAARTLRWAQRAREAITRSDQLTFAIVQGGTFEHLRRAQAQALAGLDFPGYAVGGLWVGEERRVGLAMLTVTAAELPTHKPRYLMGVGTPEDVIEAIARGMDLFDCVYPTRCARHALVLTRSGRLNLRNASYARDLRPLDASCSCVTCRTYSRAYLAHLFRAGELLAPRAVSVHNIAMLVALAGEARAAILDRRFWTWREEQLSRLGGLAATEP